jgi:hypothetical protein
MRVSVTSHFAALREKRAHSSPPKRAFAGSIPSPAADSPRQKNYAPDASAGALTGPTAVQNARISANRFALAARFPATGGASRRQRERDSRFRFGLR